MGDARGPSDERQYFYVPTPLDAIAAKTDHIFAGEERLLGDLGAEIVARLLQARANEERESVRDVIVLQLNALSTTLGSIELWRRGLLNQEAILLRNAVETLATAAVLYGDEASYRDYKNGRLNSAKSLTTVKKVWPVIGSMLAKVDGSFSNEFVHLGEIYRSWARINIVANEAHIESVRQMLTPIQFVLLVLDFLSEVTCYQYVNSPRYWRALGDGKYEFSPTAEGRAFMAQVTR